jgi:hypothetical protein
MKLNIFCDTIRKHLLERGYSQEQIDSMVITSLDVRCESKKLEFELATYSAKNGKDIDIVNIASS